MQEKKSNLDKFISANKTSPVVEGYAIGNGGEGGVYVLKSGERFTLSREESVQVTPRWEHDE